MTKQENVTTLGGEACPGARRRRSEKKLKQILDGARAVFREQGFAGASVDDIARRAGISKATMYRYFPDKAAIYSAVMHCDFQVQAELVDLQHDDMPIMQKLLTHARHHLRLILSPFMQDIFRAAVAESGRMPDFGRRFFESGPDKRRRVLAPVLAEANRRGELVVEDPDFAAFQFFSLCAAEIQFKSLFGVKQSYTEEEIEVYAATAVDTFLRAHAPHHGAGHRQTRTG